MSNIQDKITLTIEYHMNSTNNPLEWIIFHDMVTDKITEVANEIHKMKFVNGTKLEID